MHAWGKASQLEFDPKKESFHIVAGSNASGGIFKLLGVSFDNSLTMKAVAGEVATEASWKLKMLIRTRRFYTCSELTILYKAHLLASLEYRTPAIYHATRNVLVKVDRVQSKFLEDAGVGDITALTEFNVAPLTARRDMAMLAVIHRAVLGKGPRHFKDQFCWQAPGLLKDPREEIGGGIITRSILGLVAVYNLLPEKCKGHRKVGESETALQQLLKERATEDCTDWIQTFSPRVPLQGHPLKSV